MPNGPNGHAKRAIRPGRTGLSAGRYAGGHNPMGLKTLGERTLIWKKAYMTCTPDRLLTSMN